MTADQKSKLFEEIRRHPSTNSRVWRRRVVLGLGLALTLSLLIFGYVGALRPAPRTPGLILATSLGAGCVAALAFFVALGRGGSAVGRPRRVLLLLVLAVPLLLFGWKLGWSRLDPAMMASWPERPGFRCFGLSLSTGIGPLLALAMLWRDRDPVHGPLTGAAFGVASGAFAWVLVDLWCPVGYAPHLVLGHLLPMLLLTVVGAILGWRVIALREG